MPLDLPSTVLARVVVGTVSSTVGMAIVVTGLIAGAFRACAVLTGSPADRVEWLTAFGFASGMVVALWVFFLDAAVG